MGSGITITILFVIIDLLELSARYERGCAFAYHGQPDLVVSRCVSIIDLSWRDSRVTYRRCFRIARRECGTRERDHDHYHMLRSNSEFQERNKYKLELEINRVRINSVHRSTNVSNVHSSIMRASHTSMRTHRTHHALLKKCRFESSTLASSTWGHHHFDLVVSFQHQRVADTEERDGRDSLTCGFATKT